MWSFESALEIFGILPGLVVRRAEERRSRRLWPVVTADALEEVRELQKKLVVYHAKLFQGRLFVQSCRALQLCTNRRPWKSFAW